MYQAPFSGEHALMLDEPLLLTGATGFVGMELLARYLERTERRIYALVRARDDDEADARLRAAVSRVLPDASMYGDRVVAVRGDVTEPGLGLDTKRRDELAEEVGEIVHAAASVSFTLSLAESRAINVEGTRRMLELAQLAMLRGRGLRRFSYVSTAYVAGDRRGLFGEDDLDVGQGFRNPYEQSKFEAETLVRRHMAALPIQVFRPSIVVGEEDSGWTPAFNVIYWPLRAFSRGAYAALPAKVSSPVDVVSITYVADAIFELSRHAVGAGETYNLAAGPVATTVGELLDLSSSYFEQRAPTAIPPSLYKRLIHPLMLRRAAPARRTALERSEVFFPYFAMRVRYDTEHARARLEPEGIAVTPLRHYFDRLMDHAVSVRWGRTQASRPEAAPHLWCPPVRMPGSPSRRPEAAPATRS
jgi:thioester reductase-like protein